MTSISQLITFAHEHRIPVFLVCNAAALLAALCAFHARMPFAPRTRALLLATMAAGGPIGAVLLGVVLRLPRFLAQRGHVHFMADGWLMAYGALFGVAAACAGVARLRGLSPRGILDALAPSLGLLVMFGRLGCLFAGCDFGMRTSLPWAVVYPRGMPAYEDHLHAGTIDAGALFSQSVHPTQLYESLLGLAMFLVARARLGAKAREGSSFAYVMAVYALGRFGIERLRGDPRPMIGPMSLPQCVSLVVLAAVTLLLSATPRDERGGATS